MNEPQIRATGIGGGTTPVPLGENKENRQSVEQKFLDHFGLNEQPFGVTPDPRFLYLGPKHREALAALNYGTELNRGFLTLIAPPGMGKTSLLFNYLEGLRDNARSVFLFQPAGDARELMSYMFADLGLDGTGKDLPHMHKILNQVLTEEMRAGRRFILVIDEAQNLTETVLESVRLLSNFETPWMKLMQIVLAGQPQLAQQLARPSMAQLRQRISFSIQIEPLTPEEVIPYVDHRLWVAGYKGAPLFSIGARTLLAERSEGIPRNINNICFCAMSLGWATKQKTVDREMMCDVLTEMNLGPSKPKIDLAPKPLDIPKKRVVQNTLSAGLPAIRPAATAWMPRVAIVVTILFALGLFGVRIDFGKRLMVLWQGSSTAEKVSNAPTLPPLSIDPATTVSPNSPPTESITEVPTDDKDPAQQPQVEGKSTQSSPEIN